MTNYFYSRTNSKAALNRVLNQYYKDRTDVLIIDGRSILEVCGYNASVLVGDAVVLEQLEAGNE